MLVGLQATALPLGYADTILESFSEAKSLLLPSKESVKAYP